MVVRSVGAASKKPSNVEPKGPIKATMLKGIRNVVEVNDNDELADSEEQW